MMKLLTKTLAMIIAVSSVTACSNMTTSQKNTATGAAIGAAAGNIIGDNTEATLIGAALGGVVGSQVQ